MRSVSNAIETVFGRRSPSEVVGVIVDLVAIEMANLKPNRTRAVKGFAHQSVNSPESRMNAIAQRHDHVAVALSD